MEEKGHESTLSGGGEEVDEKTEGEEDDDDVPLNLDTIPIEVLLQIFQFVDATDLLRSMLLVSKYFHEILSNEMTWKIKQEKRWGGKYPPIDLFEDENQDASPEGDQKSTDSSVYYSCSFTPSTFPWSKACVKREEQIKLWATLGTSPPPPVSSSSSSSDGSSSPMAHAEISAHIGCVDSVHLFLKQNTMLLACGSRDRSISVWNAEQMLTGGGGLENGSRLKILSRAHEGWIWDFGVNSTQLVSCSWDTSAKAWDYNTFQCVGEYRTTSALLSVSCSDNLISLGCFNRKIHLLDRRTLAFSSSAEPRRPVHTYQPHSRSVLSVGLDSNYVISCGEDGLVVKHDLRTQTTLKTLKLAPTASARNPYPTCMSFRDTAINLPYFYVGDNTGAIHVVDLLRFEVAEKYNLHTAPVRGVFHNLGSVVSCSKNGKLLVRDPTLALRGIGAVDVGDKVELPCVHSLNNVVACGDGDGVIRVWGDVTGFHV